MAVVSLGNEVLDCRAIILDPTHRLMVEARFEEDLRTLLEVRQRLFAKVPVVDPLASDTSVCSATCPASPATTVLHPTGPLTASPPVASHSDSEGVDSSIEQAVEPIRWRPLDEKGRHRAGCNLRLPEVPELPCLRAPETASTGKSDVRADEGGLPVTPPRSRTLPLGEECEAGDKVDGPGSRQHACQFSASVATTVATAAKDFKTVASGAAPSPFDLSLHPEENHLSLEAETVTDMAALRQLPAARRAPGATNLPTLVATPRTCEFHIEEASLLQEFNRLSGVLQRHGFSTPQHQVEMLTQRGHESGSMRIVADGQSLLSVCAEVVSAFEDRGRRLGEAMLARRTEERQAVDARVQSLLRDNLKLEEEVKTLRSQARTKQSAAQECISQRQPSRGAPSRDGELAEAVAKVRAAEATARHRERELEKMRTRFEQVLAEGERHREKERELLARPLRRGLARDEALLETALAHQSHAEAIQAEVVSLGKQLRDVTFQLDASEERRRSLEAQQQFSTATPCQAGVHAQGGPPSQTSREVELLQRELAHERELRTHAEDHLRRQQLEYTESRSELEVSLKAAEARSRELQQYIKPEPTASEQRWQREAFRLREQVAEAQRAWHGVDTRTLMRRDKVIRSLGLTRKDGKTCDAVAAMLDVCGMLHITELRDVVAKVRSLSVAASALPNLEKYVRESLQIVGELDASSKPPEDPGQALVSLRAIGKEIRKLRSECTELSKSEQAAAREKAHVAAQVSTAEAAAAKASERNDRLNGELQRVRTEMSERLSVQASTQRESAAWQALLVELQMPPDTTQQECARRVAELCAGDALLSDLLAKFRCSKRIDLPQHIASMIQHFEESVASQRIVEALQKLLRVSGIDEVLPELREVLDVGALRRRHAAAAVS